MCDSMWKVPTVGHLGGVEHDLPHAYAAWLTFSSINPNFKGAAPAYNVSEDEPTLDAMKYIIDEWLNKTRP